ncbi:uncharacterized protein LOC114804693 [Zeugodacus cucurbitae]|uniref:Uncharacterized protein n=1 Tax=Zeugodacus cucurbitae TaxID=28588 RepID=A0A0A1WN93_ZEUCU|nr:uncharacterized protein LOC114804693 [Zeugodacus cucurbitae]
MSSCKLGKSNISCKINDNEAQLPANDRMSTITFKNINDAYKYSTVESSTSLLKATIPTQEQKRFLVTPKPKVLNICTLNPNTKEFEVATSAKNNAQTGDLPTQNFRVDINKPKHARPPFLYEHYPLKPALLYDSPLSFVREPLNRADQISYLPQRSLHSITSVTQINLLKHTLKKQKSRLISGEDDYKYTEIANAAWKTKAAFAWTEGTSSESVCSTCPRKGFLVPHTSEHYTEPIYESVETSTTREADNSAILTEVYNTAWQNIADALVGDNEKHLDEKESFLFYNPYYHYEGEIGVETPLDHQAFSSDNSRLNISPNSHQSEIKHKDSLLLYANLKQKRRKTVATLDIGEGKPLRFTTFFDEAQLANKSSDENIIFGSARGIKYKLQCWEESRIGWLSELERRHEVHRRRQKRAELRKLKQQTAKSRSGLCSFWCQRLRFWLAKWDT